MKKKIFGDYLKVIPGVFLALALICIVFANGIITNHSVDKQATEYLTQASDRAATS